MPPRSATRSATVWGRRLLALCLAASTSAATPGVWAGREIGRPLATGPAPLSVVQAADPDGEPAYELVLLAMLGAVASLTQRRRLAG